jgi:SAM-dependent methyltransferase
MSVRPEAAVGFDREADAYERGRPGYPAQAIDWLAAQLQLGAGRTIVDVGAGTGKLTRELLSTGAEVVAIEPVAGMRSVLTRHTPQARVLEGTAEALSLDSGSADAIVVAQAFHWFDGPRALAEFHRVLRPGGGLALIWNRRRVDQPMHREIDEIIEPYRRGTPSHRSGEWRRTLEVSALFAPVAEHVVQFGQTVDAQGFVDRIVSISFIAALEADDRAQVQARLRALIAKLGGSVTFDYGCELSLYRRTPDS